MRLSALSSSYKKLQLNISMEHARPLAATEFASPRTLVEVLGLQDFVPDHQIFNVAPTVAVQPMELAGLASLPPLALGLGMPDSPI